ncbi:hypothetical protein Hanom_Chr08g00730271 [Helianthus anomalus]
MTFYLQEEALNLESLNTGQRSKKLDQLACSSKSQLMVIANIDIQTNGNSREKERILKINIFKDASNVEESKFRSMNLEMSKSLKVHQRQPLE